jgi:hypothetical protein
MISFVLVLIGTPAFNVQTSVRTQAVQALVSSAEQAQRVPDVNVIPKLLGDLYAPGWDLTFSYNPLISYRGARNYKGAQILHNSHLRLQYDLGGRWKIAHEAAIVTGILSVAQAIEASFTLGSPLAGTEYRTDTFRYLSATGTSVYRYRLSLRDALELDPHVYYLSSRSVDNTTSFFPEQLRCGSSLRFEHLLNLDNMLGPQIDWQYATIKDAERHLWINPQLVWKHTLTRNLNLVARSGFLIAESAETPQSSFVVHSFPTGNLALQSALFIGALRLTGNLSGGVMPFLDPNVGILEARRTILSRWRGTV